MSYHRAHSKLSQSEMDTEFPEDPRDTRTRLLGAVAQTDYFEFSIWVSSDKSGSKGLSLETCTL